MNVVNMSLGASSDIQSFHDAVIRAHDAGIVLVAAAGNDSGAAVSYPGAYPEVIAVSATDNTNTIAYFSSVGPEVDLAAPGVGIFSSYKGQTYATLSGTSMASPHVAGVAALLLSQPVKCDTDLSGTCSPSEVQSRLESTATDLGTAGKDSQYGSGLVNAWAALQ
jgi:subtilisin family serine protease